MPEGPTVALAHVFSPPLSASGWLARPLAGEDFIARAKTALAAPVALFAGALPAELERVAVVGGGMFAVYPLGWLSDKLGRAQVLAGLGFAAEQEWFGGQQGCRRATPSFRGKGPPSDGIRRRGRRGAPQVRVGGHWLPLDRRVTHSCFPM